MDILTWRDAAKLLIETNDLDPMYQVVKKVRDDYEDEWYHQFLMYYALFYDPQTAFHAIDVEPKDFWPWVRNQALSPVVKRGPERRHFRGDNAARSIRVLSAKGSPTDIFNDLYRPSYTDMANHIETNYKGSQFGPYFTWKLMDFFHVCSGKPIPLTYTEFRRFIPEQPKKALAELFGNVDHDWKINEFVSNFKHPVRDGLCSFAETETILCNYKGLFVTDTVWIGRDIHDYRMVLKNTGYARYLPNDVPRGKYHCVRTPYTFDL